MPIVAVDKEKGFIGPGIYYQCLTITDIKDVFLGTGISEVMFTHGAKLTEDDEGNEEVGHVITNRPYAEGFTPFDRPMSGEEMAGAFGVMLALEQNPNTLNPLHPPTSIERYVDHTQTEPVTKHFELFIHRNDGDCSVYLQRTLKPRADVPGNKNL